MKFELQNDKDFFAGLLLILVGAGGFLMALDYPLGTAMRMGPGYFPRVLAGIYVLRRLHDDARHIDARRKSGAVGAGSRSRSSWFRSCVWLPDGALRLDSGAGGAVFRRGARRP